LKEGRADYKVSRGDESKFGLTVITKCCPGRDVGMSEVFPCDTLSAESLQPVYPGGYNAVGKTLMLRGKQKKNHRFWMSPRGLVGKTQKRCRMVMVKVTLG